MTRSATYLALAAFVLAGCATTPPEQAPTEPVASSPVLRLRQNLAELREATKADPENADLHYKLGNAYFDLAEFEQARRAYEAAVRLDPDHAAAYCNLGLSLKRLGSLNKAVEAYRAALEIAPDDATALGNLIVALQTAGDLAGAADQLERLAGLRPGDVNVRSQLAHVLFRLRRYEEAADAFRDVMRLDPGLSNHYYNLGLCYYCMDDLDATLTSWLAALAHDPDNPSVNKGLAVVYWRRGDFKQAWNAVVKCRLKGVPLDPEFITGLQTDSGQMGPE